ncbi:hypothetical protein, conserved [Eimeria necatrix]|uniref:Rhoptry neck protein n=1 Tax=Eimeria necatrix TaxID=51315 RepID=U6MUT2_9EIME|nr:hypothetical protein, conserved [Eimeria necatrix]CDJ67751.1 hypothetical protein, conserved [Eimeria necatrix]
MMLGLFNIFLLPVLLFVLPFKGATISLASSFSLTPTQRFEGPTNIPTAILSLDSTVESLKGNESSSQSGHHTDFLSLICPASSLSPDVTVPPSRDQNIEELELMLLDNGLEQAANKLWLAFYGGEATSTAPSVEEWSAQHLEMLKDIDLPGEEGTPPAAHRSQLFFLRSMLASGSEVPEERSGLQEALLNKLRSIAGVALGGSAIGNHLGHAHESVQEVHQHNYLEKNKATEPTGSPLPRSIVPIVGTRNPFFVMGQVNTLVEAGVPVEPGMPLLHNMKRLHTETCLPSADGSVHIPCVLEESSLFEESHELTKISDDFDQQVLHSARAESLKQAHTTISGLGALDCKISSHRAKSFSGADWGLQPVLVDDILEQGKARTLERLNVAVATMLTTSSLDSTSSYWLAFDHRTVQQAIEDLKKSVLQILGSLQMESVATRLLRGSLSEISHEEFEAVVSRLRNLGETTDGLRAALALYSIWYPRQKEIALQNRTWVKILYSHGFVPDFVRNIYFRSTAGVLKRAREKRIQKAREVLRKNLPSAFFKNLFRPFKFTAHSAALMQIINFHSMKHDEAVGDMKKRIGEGPSPLLRQKAVSALMDAQIQAWASHGLSSTLLESHVDFATFKRAWSKIDLKGLPLPDLTDWWSRLHYFVVQGLESYLALEKHLEPLEDTVYTLATDSLNKLKADGGQTLFFTRVAYKKRQGPLRRLWEGAKKSLMSLLYRSPSRQHGVWFGVTVDFDQLHGLLDQLKEVIEAAPSLGIKVNMQEALLREVETELRVQGADVSRVPFLEERNIGMLGVRRDYGSLSEAAREEEFQASMCLDHCRGLWQMALSGMLPTMLRPETMQRYEKAFGTTWALKHLSDPALVNSRRMILKSDAALSFFDYSTPKEIREELKGLESGQATMFAYYMLFSSRVQQRLGNQYLGLHLRQQAPFMGNMLLEWISTRRRHAVAAIISSFVLTFMGIYAAMSFLDILQNLTVSGASPPFDCVWNPVFQEMACNPVPGGAALGTAWVTALEQVFLIGLFSGSAGGMSLVLTINSAIAVIVNQSKTLMRLQMCLGSTVMGLLRKGASSFSRVRQYFDKRRAVKRVMLQRALAGMKSGSTATLMSNSEATELADGVLAKLIGTSRATLVKGPSPKASPK